jgi:hypothetical protein
MAVWMLADFALTGNPAFEFQFCAGQSLRTNNHFLSRDTIRPRVVSSGVALSFQICHPMLSGVA